MSGLQPDGTFVTGTGQTLGGLHSIERCRPQHCVIHNPSDHHMRDWPTHFRDDRHLMERMCPHGVGHPDPDASSSPSCRLSVLDVFSTNVIEE